jgi:hypothetical protein
MPTRPVPSSSTRILLQSPVVSSAEAVLNSSEAVVSSAEAVLNSSEAVLNSSEAVVSSAEAVLNSSHDTRNLSTEARNVSLDAHAIPCYTLPTLASPMTVPQMCDAWYQNNPEFTTLADMTSFQSPAASGMISIQSPSDYTPHTGPPSSGVTLGDELTQFPQLENPYGNEIVFSSCIGNGEASMTDEPMEVPGGDNLTQFFSSCIDNGEASMTDEPMEVPVGDNLTQFPQRENPYWNEIENPYWNEISFNSCIDNGEASMTDKWPAKDDTVDSASSAGISTAPKQSHRSLSSIIKTSNAIIKGMQKDMATQRKRTLRAEKRATALTSQIATKDDILKRFRTTTQHFVDRFEATDELLRLHRLLRTKTEGELRTLNEKNIKDSDQIKESVEQARYANLFGISASRGEAICPITRSRLQPNEAVLQFVSSCDCNCLITFSKGLSFLKKAEENTNINCLSCNIPGAEIVATTAGKAEDLFAWRKLQRLVGASTDDELVEKRNDDMDTADLQKIAQANAYQRMRPCVD